MNTVLREEYDETAVNQLYVAEIALFKSVLKRSPVLVASVGISKPNEASRRRSHSVEK
jgi:hypothetical protein